MTRIISFAAITLSLLPALAQTPTSPTVLHATSQLVALDVVVLDRSGHAVPDLDATSFRITEDKTPQNIRHFEPHTSTQSQPPLAQLPKLAPGFFMDYTPAALDGVLNILLIDSLNTAPEDQAYLNQQLLKYLDGAPPSRRVAIFGFNGRLVLLQGFTSDPEVLRRAIKLKALPRKSAILDPAPGYTPDTNQMSAALTRPEPQSPDVPPLLAETIKHLDLFERESNSEQSQRRVNITLDALTTLGHYLSALPGHKNLLWFSGSFPLAAFPIPTSNTGFADPQVNVAQFRDTVNLFMRAKVALFPIDARGLQSPPSYDATSQYVPLRPSFDSSPNSGSAVTGVRNDPTLTQSPDHLANSIEYTDHVIMDAIAAETGGRAFYHTNDLAAAASKAFDLGSDFYALAYTPTNHTANNAYRTIHVELAGPAAARGYKLLYRHGYYAEPSTAAPPASSAQTPEAQRRHAEEAYGRQAMAFGAPAPESILFQARIMPTADAPQPQPIADNHPNPHAAFHAPFRTLRIDTVALTPQFHFEQPEPGRHTGGVEVLAYLYSANGALLNTAGRTLSFDMTDAEYNDFLKRLLVVHFDLSYPQHGETYIRLALRDIPTNRYGVLEHPVFEINALPPLPATMPPPRGAPPS